MSCNYADGLSPYHDKGQLGLAEKFDNNSIIGQKVDILAKWIAKAKHVVLHTGAGISTSAGIPDFRGPKGVWTLQAKGEKPDLSKDFNEAIPTATHMAITKLIEIGKAKYVVSQNIDGLHLRSGLPRKFLSELHGNMFIEQCNQCNRQFVRNRAVPTVGQKTLSKACPTVKTNGRACRGRLHDTILDWEHSLPENDLAMADFHSCLADVSIALGTTMQIVPSGSLPLYTKKAGGKLVIINLQPTKHDLKADLLIHGYADEVMTLLMKKLVLKIPKYTVKCDPTRLSLSSDKYFEWTISDAATAEMRKIYESKCGSKEAKKRLEVIDDEDDLPLISRIKTPNSKETEKPSRKRKGDDSSVSKYKSKNRSFDDDDDDLEVIGDFRRGRGRPKKGPAALLPPPKLTIKKNVTPTKTKYVIVTKKPERKRKKDTKIVYDSDSNVPDLEMICESDDEVPLTFTTNFRRYLHDDKTFKREVKSSVDESIGSIASSSMNSSEIKDESIKDENMKDISDENSCLKGKQFGKETNEIVAHIINYLIDVASKFDLSDDKDKNEVIDEPKQCTESAPETVQSDIPTISDTMEVDDVIAEPPTENLNHERPNDGNNNNADGIPPEILVEENISNEANVNDSEISENNNSDVITPSEILVGENISTEANVNTSEFPENNRSDVIVSPKISVEDNASTEANADNNESPENNSSDCVVPLEIPVDENTFNEANVNDIEMPENDELVFEEPHINNRESNVLNNSSTLSSALIENSTCTMDEKSVDNSVVRDVVSELDLICSKLN